MEDSLHSLHEIHSKYVNYLVYGQPCKKQLKLRELHSKMAYLFYSSTPLSRLYLVYA